MPADSDAHLPGWERYQGWILAGTPTVARANRRSCRRRCCRCKTAATRREFALSGDRRMYINRGTGHLLRVRLNVRPEVTVFELQPA